MARKCSHDEDGVREIDKMRKREVDRKTSMKQEVEQQREQGDRVGDKSSVIQTTKFLCTNTSPI